MIQPKITRRHFFSGITALAAVPIIGKTDSTLEFDAGAAGLSATAALREEGKSVLCIEANHRIGGRAYTDTSLFGIPYDLGAHWLHYDRVSVC